MILTITDDFDLEKIAESGQCFRWKRLDKTTYRIIQTDQCLYVSSLGDNQYELDCDDETFQSVWSSYFDLETNYQSIRERIPEEDGWTDDHPLCHLRVNVVAAQFPEFQETYGIRPGDGMYVAPEDRIVIWRMPDNTAHIILM